MIAAVTRILKTCERAFFRARGWYSTTIRGTEFRCDPYHVDFWRLCRRSRWEARTFEILHELLHPESVYVDVGAWIGPTVIVAARRCRQVYCLEPDYVAYRYLLWNIALNNLHNVAPFNIGLAGGNGTRRMASRGAVLGDSMTSLIGAEKKNGGIDVRCLTWADWTNLAGVGKIDLIKMDIEGGEFELLPSMREYLMCDRPALHLSLHPHVLEEDRRRDAMQSLVDSIRGYRTCMNDERKPVPVESLLHNELLNTPASYLLTD